MDTSKARNGRNASTGVPADDAERCRVAALDGLLGRRLPVLNDGFVRLVDYMGSDGSIVQAARVSYGKGTRRVHEDRGLIRYLMRHRHTTPFEMCEVKLHVRVPMDCWRQWIRHRTASVNEYSTRYSEAIDAAQQTSEDAWRQQSSANRQGSGDTLDAETGARLSARERQLQALAREVYDERLARGVAREQARKDLPLSTYTEAYWKINLHNLLHFLALRMDPSAQQEIAAYANVIGEQIVQPWVPLTWEAFVDYRLEAMSLSRVEQAVLAALHRDGPEAAIAVAELAGLLPREGDRLKPNRERAELEEKLARLGVDVAWH